MIVHVVADEVADTIEAVILGPNLGTGRGRVDAGESHQTSSPKAEEATVERAEAGEKDGRGGAVSPAH